MDNNKVIDQINKILAKTKDRKIPWKYANANVVRWIRQDQDRLFTVTIQKQPGVIALGQFGGYTITIQATNPNEIVLQINSKVENGYDRILEELFNTAMTISRESSSDTIDKLLGDL